MRMIVENGVPRRRERKERKNVMKGNQEKISTNNFNNKLHIIKIIYREEQFDSIPHWCIQITCIIYIDFIIIPVKRYLISRCIKNLPGTYIFLILSRYPFPRLKEFREKFSIFRRQILIPPHSHLYTITHTFTSMHNFSLKA